MKIIKLLEQAQYLLAVVLTFTGVYATMQLFDAMFLKGNLNLISFTVLLFLSALVIFLIKKIDIRIERLEEILEQRINLKKLNQTVVSTDISIRIKRSA
ncbi:hypothetical protein ABC382_00780 [Lysinibacillus sp. 1P01SD]|uniref:hypothetical protein n=1 Tax=Lysinibacillus sp. 1P01SD TaxID=3132285 RepID=UPI0039A38A09